MTQTPTTEETQDELSWEAAVVRYLEEHPEFFEQHPDMLARLQLSHETRGGTVSLIERQVQVLRAREVSLDRQLRELVNNARDNDVIGNRLHRFARLDAGVPGLEAAGVPAPGPDGVCGSGVAASAGSVFAGDSVFVVPRRSAAEASGAFEVLSAFAADCDAAGAGPRAEAAIPFTSSAWPWTRAARLRRNSFSLARNAEIAARSLCAIAGDIPAAVIAAAFSRASRTI